MANKSNPASQTISTPQGGGSLHGIGETFSPDLHTGTGNFTVPIALPPGRSGFQPQLSLVYSTGNGNVPYGLGWSLTIPGVSRKTSKGIPRYQDDPDLRHEGDTFILSGAEDLVPVAETEAITRYRPRTEGLFARIEHHALSETNHWELRSKDGLVSIYGTHFSLTDDDAVIANPDHRAQVFSWKLTKTIDPFGNKIQYEYERDSGDTINHHWDQLYLKRIQYAEYTKPIPNGNPADKFLIFVTFIYEDRPDSFSDHRAGFEIRTHADRERLGRTYRLIYLDQRGLPNEQLPLNAASLLCQVLVEGHDQAFRLKRLRSERYSKPNDSYSPSGEVVQDFGYDYDLVGNILAIRTPGSGVLNNPEAFTVTNLDLAQLLVSGNALNRRFDYYPIYRLLSATGRECDRPSEGPPFEGQPRCSDLTKTRSYTEHYRYAMGNMLRAATNPAGSPASSPWRQSTIVCAK